VVLAIEGRAEWSTADCNRARRPLVVEAGRFGVPGLSADAASRAHVLHGVFVEFGDVSVGGISEKCGGGRSAAASPSVDVSTMPLLHVELGESSHNRVAESIVVVIAHLPWRKRASNGTAKPELLSLSEASRRRKKSKMVDDGHRSESGRSNMRLASSSCTSVNAEG